MVLGRVLDDETGEPIETVEVRLFGAGEDLVRVTDSKGEFLIPRVRPGTYEVVLTHLAYGTHTDTIRIERGELLTYEARLAMRPIELEPLMVTVARRSVSPMLLGFYERMSMGRGLYFTREDIEQRQPGRITQMLGDLPGLRVVQTGGPATGETKHYVLFRRYQRLGFDPCLPMIYVDRTKIARNSGGGPAPSLDGFVMPSEVEAVEVYDGPASLPAEFGGSDAGCGVIVIWTRRGT